MLRNAVLKILHFVEKECEKKFTMRQLLTLIKVNEQINGLFNTASIYF